MPQALRRSGILALSVILSFALAVSAGPAFADEGSDGSQIAPSKADYEALLNNGTGKETAPETNPEAAEELPRVDLEREEAEKLLAAVFPEQLEGPPGIFDELEVEHFKSDHVAVVPAEKDGKPAGLLQSLLPLRVENEEGEKEVVDLRLEEVEGELQPANPIVEVGVPAELGEGISIPGLGVEIAVAGAPSARAPSTVTESVAFYPNIAEDTDLSVAPTPTGVETLTQLRSADAPTTQTFRLDLPAGARLRSTSEGGAEIVGEDDKTLLTASRPTAMDAAGLSVPVSLSVQDDAVTLTVFPESDAQYPILVDPYWETYYWEVNNSIEGLQDWLPASNSPLLIPTGRGIYGEAGLNILAFPGSIVAGSQANWNYHVPRYFSDFESTGERPTSWIRSMAFTKLRWWNEEGQPFHSDPFFVLGIWDENNGWWAWDWVHTGLGGNLLNQSAIYALPYNAGESNPYKGVKMGGITVATSEWVSRPRHLLVGQAVVEITDEDTPGVSKAQGPARWQDQTPTEPIIVRETDPGLGIYSTLAKAPGINGVKNQWEQTVGCFGNESHPCPRTWEGAYWTYNPAVMPQGINYVEIIGKDPVWHFSDQAGTQRWAEVKVDHTPPTLALSGPATEQTNIGVNRQNYELKINATDGTSGAPQSGVVEVKVFVDNKERPQPENWPKGCSTQNCLFNGKWIFNANEFAEGTHTVKVTATDAVGRTEVKSFALELHPVSAPTITLSGTMTEQAMLGTTRPRYKLKVTGSVMGELLSPGDGSPVYLNSFGSAGSEEGQFSHPAGLAAASNGNTWVADQGNNRIEKFDPEGEYLTSIGSAGSGNGQFKSPKGVAIDGKGQLWVLDGGNRRVQKFGPGGEYLDQFGSAGSGNGQLSEAEGIAVDSKGNVWVADTYNARIQKFNEKGEFVRVVGTAGSGVGQLREPTGIAIDSVGNVWVTDWANNKVVEFNEAGTYVRQFGTAGSGNGQFSHPDAISINPRGDVFVVDQGNNRVQQFDQTGTYVAKFGSSGSGAGEFAFSYPVGIASDASGNVWVSDTNHNRVQKWAFPNYVPGYAASFGSSGGAAGQFSHPAGITHIIYNSIGYLWVVDEGHNRVEAFDEGGNYVGVFGSTGSGNGQFNRPTAIAADLGTGAWVLDSGNHRAVHVNVAGTYLGQLGTAGSGNGQLSEAEGIAVDSKGNVWVADTYNARIQKFNEKGEFVRVVGTAGTGVGQLERPTGIAVDPSGNVWVTDWANNKVVEFNEAGSYVSQFGTAGSGSGQFNHPDAIVIDGKGTVWVGDEGNGRIQGFSQTGEYLGEFGSPGSGTGQFSFSYPMGMASDGKGKVWISDTGNNRVQRWSESTLRTQVGSEIYVDGQLVASKESWCLQDGCAANQSWTLNSAGTETGTHNVVAKVIDGFGNTVSKSLSIEIQRDNVKPELEVGGELVNAPEGWVQQEEYGLTVTARDPNGYGLKSLEFKVDGQLKASILQACPDGACAATLSRQVNMSNYFGGAHTAELVATDGANNSSSKRWAINVDPEGHISTAEATATLEAVEETSPAAVLSQEEEGGLGSPALEIEGGQISVSDTKVPTQLPVQPGGTASLQVLYENPFLPVCTAQQEEAPVLAEPCQSQVKWEAEQQRIDETANGSYPGLEQLTITPIHVSQEASSGEIVGEAAAVYPNALQHQDGIIRPIYDGFLTFVSIRDWSASGIYEWEVELEPGQSLVSTGPQTAAAYFADGHLAMGIRAESAHDAIGSTVPTTLTVSQGNILKMTVQFHQQSPAGGPYIMPIIAGAGWEGGWHSEQREIPSEEPPPGSSLPSDHQALELLTQTSLIVGAPEPVSAAEGATASVAGEARRPFVRSACGHNFQWYEGIQNAPHFFEFACGNAFRPNSELDESIVWRGTMKGAFLYAPGHRVWHNGARACTEDAPGHSKISEYHMDSAYECHYGPKTSDGNGGASASVGHYLRAQAHWTLWHRGECEGRPNSCPPDVYNPWLSEDKALELHLWPSGMVDITVGDGNPGAGEE